MRATRGRVNDDVTGNAEHPLQQRRCQYLVGWPVGEQFAVGDNGHGVEMPEHQVEVVHGGNHGAAEVVEYPHQSQSPRRVEMVRGFVENKCGSVLGQGTGENDAVSLTSGKVNTRSITPSVQTNSAQGVVDDVPLAVGSMRPRIAVRGPAESHRFGNG